jgi:tetratricopeptide (TPR) repeat protein
MRRGEYASAEASFAAAEKEPPFPDVSLRRAQALLKLGRVQEAKKSARRALDRLNPSSPLALSSGPTKAEIRALRNQAAEIAASNG